jgi:hypothetical protein
MSEATQISATKPQTPTPRHKAMDWVFSLIPDVSLETANKFYTFGWAASLIGAAVTFTGVIFLMWGTRVRDHDFESQMSALNVEAASARERAETIKAAVAWRELTPELISALEQALSATPGLVNLRYTDGDPESLYLAIQFSNVLAKAKWQVAPGALKFGNSIIFGLVLPDENTDGQKLRAAFKAANIPFATALPQTNTMSGSNISMIPNAPILMIGSRPPPKLP